MIEMCAITYVISGSGDRTQQQFIKLEQTVKPAKYFALILDIYI